MSHYKPNPGNNVNLTINGIPVTVPEGTRILEAARKAGVHIPTLCDHKDLCRRSVCRICVVECDGRGKLLAACANDVSEGLSVVTNNARIINIRKMIIELLLAEHPNECLSCIRSKNCELQTLAANFGSRELLFSHGDGNREPEEQWPDRRPAVIEGKALVRDMDKCVKCGRCVEACQEVQEIRTINSSYRGVHYEISKPYGQALADGSCVFCGHCAAVCPVGAIFENDNGDEAWAVLHNSERRAAVQFDPALHEAVNNALGLPPGTVSPGKIVNALRRLGFNRVFNAELSLYAAAVEESRLLRDRMENGGILPVITGCSAGLAKFIGNFYPDLLVHLSPVEKPRQIFGSVIKTAFPDITDIVAIEPCIARKFIQDESDLVLTVKELSRMFKLAGINFAILPESPFDAAEGDAPKAVRDYFRGGKDMKPAESRDERQGIQETELVFDGKKTRHTVVWGFANARTVLDSVRKGECDSSLVEIMCCPPASVQSGCNGSMSPGVASSIQNS
ncbi:MAG: 2Fe-2S iron-sulfur cluster-binding protein [Treponema sp.]|nr:2Fe-2S iron-sulfur cluster-binding protein [Treponema sp.]